MSSNFRIVLRCLWGIFKGMIEILPLSGKIAFFAACFLYLIWITITVSIVIVHLPGLVYSIILVVLPFVSLALFIYAFACIGAKIEEN